VGIPYVGTAPSPGDVAREEGGVPTFIQDTEPVISGPAIWYQTSGGVVIKKWVQLS